MIVDKLGKQQQKHESWYLYQANYHAATSVLKSKLRQAKQMIVVVAKKRDKLSSCFKIEFKLKSARNIVKFHRIPTKKTGLF